MTTAYRISSVRSASGELKVWRTILSLGVRSRWRAREIACWKSQLSLHALTILLYRVRTLTSHDTEESKNSPESPYLGEIKRMRKQCVSSASPFFARAGDEAKLSVDLKAASAWSRSQVKRHGVSNYCRDVVVPRDHVRIDSRFSPSFCFSLGRVESLGTRLVTG